MFAMAWVEDEAAPSYAQFTLEKLSYPGKLLNICYLFVYQTQLKHKGIGSDQAMQECHDVKDGNISFLRPLWIKSLKKKSTYL